MTTSTRETILAQALDLFSKRGYGGVGVQDIASAAGVAKPTLYHYFKSKQGLLETLLDHSLEPFLAGLEACAPSGSLEEDLRECAGLFFAFAEDKPRVYRLFLSFVFASPESPQFAAASVHAQRQFEAVQGIFAANSRSLGGLGRDIPYFAAMYQGLLHNHITLFLLGHAVLGPGAEIRAARLFLHGMIPPEGR